MFKTIDASLHDYNIHLSGVVCNVTAVSHKTYGF